MNKRHRQHLKITIECADQQLPTAIAQIGESVQINLTGPATTLGNVQVPQITQVKNVELLPQAERPSVEIPILPNGRRINHG